MRAVVSRLSGILIVVSPSVAFLTAAFSWHPGLHIYLDDMEFNIYEAFHFKRKKWNLISTKHFISKEKKHCVNG